MLLNCIKIKQRILKESLHGDDEEFNQFQEIGQPHLISINGTQKYVFLYDISYVKLYNN
jgi:hypothetical protein